jgi:hypothetical protein
LKPSIILVVSSVDPSSETTISKSWRDCLSTLLIVSEINSAPLKVGMQTEISGLFVGMTMSCLLLNC